MTLILLSTDIAQDVEVNLSGSPSEVKVKTTDPTVEKGSISLNLFPRRADVSAATNPDDNNIIIFSGNSISLVEAEAEAWVDTIPPTVEILKPSQILTLAEIPAEVKVKIPPVTVALSDDDCPIGKANVGSGTKNPYVNDGTGIQSIGQGTQLSPEDVIKSVFDRTNNSMRLSFAGTSSDVYDHSSDVGQILKAVFDPDTDTIRVVEV